MDFLILTVYKGLIYRSSSLIKVPSDMVWCLGQPFYQRGPGWTVAETVTEVVAEAVEGVVIQDI